MRLVIRAAGAGIIGICLITILCIGFFYVVDFCGPYAIEEEYLSSDGQNNAVVYFESCGAFDGSNPAVSILPASFDTGDLEVIEKDLKRSVVFKCYRCGNVIAEWRAPDHLAILFSPPIATGFVFESPDEYISKMGDEYRSVHIDFFEIPGGN